ncbi:MAG: bis-aminopropyl spermidine synthase family protein [Desulfitobacteriaceae bacterium]|nr:bis-aminopropyl spermidine synthase family protein [Desulfitobacteriaceae bacterium]
MEEAYKEYSDNLPLDLIKASPGVKSYWRRNNQFSNVDFYREIDLLQNSKNLDDFIKKSSGDFDNLANIIDIALKQNIIKIAADGKITKTFHFHFKKEKNDKAVISRLLPKSNLNQFPCDNDSRIVRYKFIKSRYPFAEYLRFAVIGEDDFLSTEFVNDAWAYPVVIEKDPRIVGILKKLTERFEIVEIDVRDFPSCNNFPSVQTFITDPPYTLDGSLAFIYAGVKMLKKDKETREFYVVLNPTMMGKNIFAIQKVLADSGIYLVETISNFSQYQLPDNFNERKRADRFLNNNLLNSKMLHYSSSSNLYIFKTISPNLNNLKKQIDYKKIYEHYL